MKFKLRAGAELDSLTQDELDASLARALEALHERRRVDEQAPRWIRADASGQLDANGNGIIDVYRVRQGQELRVRRFLLEVDGYNAAASFQGGGIQLLRDGLLESFQGGPLPALGTCTEGAEPHMRNGDLVQLQVIAGPANAMVTATVEGPLYIGAP